MTPTEETTTRGPVSIPEPPLAGWLFGSGRAALVWLVARVWLGWEYLRSGWRKVFGGELDPRFWEWGARRHAFTGDANIGWVRGAGDVGPGDVVASAAAHAVAASEGRHPDPAYDWYVSFLEWVRDTSHPWLGPAVAIGELVVGVLLILGLLTGVAATLGVTLSVTFALAGSVGANPAAILVSVLLVLAWRNAGWVGLDRWALPVFGVPWHRGRPAVAHRERERGAEPVPAGE